MAFKPREEANRLPVAATKPSPPATEKKAVTQQAAGPMAQRLGSLDAFRGLTMLFMASSGLAIDEYLAKHAEILNRFDGTAISGAWKTGVRLFGYQFDHVAWTGCSAWDLIQPSFMFMVGAAMPFSYAARAARGDSWLRQFGHAALRSLILILLGIFLRSRYAPMTNFTFEDVLTQIGLGYLFAFLLVGRPFLLQLGAVLAILGGYWFFFFQHPLPPPEGNLVTRYLTEVRHLPPKEWNQFSGLAAHWNKHTNAAAEADRVFLNLFPRPEQPWPEGSPEAKRFWVNGGGYQTLNFVPSLATILFGLMAGELLRSLRTPRRKLQILWGTGLICFVVAMALDTTIWPFPIPNVSYSFCPIVKKIWTPTWAVFSAGWAFWFLAMFYWVVDLRGFRRLAFPLVVVGMNSIAVYCMHQLIEGWLVSSLKTHLGTVDAAAHTSLVSVFFGGGRGSASSIWLHCAILLMVWLICLWLYRRRIFIRI